MCSVCDNRTQANVGSYTIIRDNELIGERANRMGNRARAFKLLDLLTVGLNGRANERGFAKAIRIYLEGNHGTTQLHQRPHDDLKGAPSLFV